MNIHEMHIRMCFRSAAKHIIVGSQHGHRIFPSRQTGGFRVTHSVGRIKNVRHENFAAAGKTILNLCQRGFQPPSEAINPRLRFFQTRAIHRLFARRCPTVIMDDVIAAGGQNHDAQNIGRVRWQRTDLSFHDFRRSASRYGEVRGLELWKDGSQTNTFHFGELIRRVFRQWVEIGITFARPETSRHAVAQPDQKNRTFCPSGREQI